MKRVKNVCTLVSPETGNRRKLTRLIPSEPGKVLAVCPCHPVESRQQCGEIGIKPIFADWQLRLRMLKELGLELHSQ